MIYYFEKKDFFRWYKSRYPNAKNETIECDYFQNISLFEEVNAFLRSSLGHSHCCYNCITCCDCKHITEIGCMALYLANKHNSSENAGLNDDVKRIILNRLENHMDLGIY
jgi:ubiquinone biosynthesis protein Coq4